MGLTWGGIDRNKLVANWKRSVHHFSRLYALATHHPDHFWIDRLGDDSTLSSDILEHLMQGLRLDLLALEIAAGIVEIKHHSALLQFLDKEVIPLFWANI